MRGRPANGVALEGPVWQRVAEFEFDGLGYRQSEVFFLARVDTHEVDTSGFDDLERRAMVGHRWWSIDEMDRSDDVIYPRRLPVEMRRLLADGLPETPDRWASDRARHPHPGRSPSGDAELGAHAARRAGAAARRLHAGSLRWTRSGRGALAGPVAVGVVLVDLSLTRRRAGCATPSCSRPEARHALSRSCAGGRRPMPSVTPARGDRRDGHPARAAAAGERALASCRSRRTSCCSTAPTTG